MSSSISVQEYLLGEYTTMKAHTMMGDVTWGVIRNHLTQKLGTLVEPLNEACKSAFQDELPDCNGESSYALCFFCGQLTNQVNTEQNGHRSPCTTYSSRLSGE